MEGDREYMSSAYSAKYACPEDCCERVLSADLLQEPLTAFFQALQSLHSPGQDFRGLRVRSLQLCLQLLSEEHPDGHRLVALLRDHLVNVRPEEATETVQIVLDVFCAGVAATLQLLPPLLTLAALPCGGGAGPMQEMLRMQSGRPYDREAKGASSVLVYAEDGCGGILEPCHVPALVETITQRGWAPQDTASVLNTLAELRMCAPPPGHATVSMLLPGVPCMHLARCMLCCAGRMQ